MKLYKQTYLNNANAFHEAIKYVINMHFFYGIDIRKKQSGHFLCNLLFLVHLIFGLLFFCHAFLKAELQSENVQVFVWSIGMLTMSMQNVVMKIVYRWSSKRLAALVNNMASMNEFIPFEERQSVLRQIKVMSICGALFPASFLVIHISRQIEIYCFSKNTVTYGGETFRYLQENYHIDDIFRLIIALPCFVFFLQGTLLFIPVYINNRSVFEHINKLNDVVEYIKIHQEIRHLFKIAQQALEHFFIWGFGTILVAILFFARTVATSPENISVSAVILLFVYFPILVVHIIFIAKINDELQISLRNLQNTDYRMKVKGKILGPKERAYLLEKLELYAVHVTLENPYIKLFGVGKVVPRIVVGILGFIFNYICILYEK